MKKIIYGMLIGILAFCMCACGLGKTSEKTAPMQTASCETDLEKTVPETGINADISAETTKNRERTAEDVIKDIVIYFGYYQEEAEEKIEVLFNELEKLDSEKYKSLREILDYWRYVNNEMPVNFGVLPDGLPEDDSLCIVVLGFALMPDGTMKPELIGRLETALQSAKKYPNAYILCTGGGTASEKPDITEAGKMAEWLIGKGIPESRIIVEDDSRTTVENAVLSYNLIKEQYPQINTMAIVSSDYHVPRGVLLFQTKCMLAENSAVPGINVISNGAYLTNTKDNSAMLLQTGGMLELMGFDELANQIYMGKFEPPVLEIK